MVGLPDGEKKLMMCDRLDTIPACNRQTNILRRHSSRYAYPSRSKNSYLIACEIVNLQISNENGSCINIS